MMPKEAVQTMVLAPPYHSPADDHAIELNGHIKRIAESSNKPWHKTATGWFALIAAFSSFVAAIASLLTAIK